MVCGSIRRSSSWTGKGNSVRRFKLANVLLEADDYLKNDTGLLYHKSKKAKVYSRDGVMYFTGRVDFCTYFNAVSVAKWRRYTGIVSIRLHLELAGDPCRVNTVGYGAKGSSNPKAYEVTSGGALFDAATDFKTHEIDIPMGDSVVSGFSLSTVGRVRVRNIYYYTLVDESQVRDVRLAVCTTTFKKEEFIVPNIGRIRSGIVKSDEPVSQGFHLFVVDNGQTLDAEALSGEGVSVIPNVNAGGAGGFARGMMAAREHENDFTHVVLMDDDVRMSVESIKRLHSLLSLVSSEYARAFVNGAMLQLERPSLLFEDVSYVRNLGGFAKVKPDLLVDQLDGIVKNEVIDVEVENAYGAWWFSCIPMSYIDEMGLPMPFFVRCDDVEYGLRCDPTYMTMNGICVWHARFEGRFNAAVACYQYVRNMLVVRALHIRGGDVVFMLLYWRLFNIYIRTMDYAAAELWLDGLEDYLKGPDVLMKGDPFEKMRAAIAKAEKFVPVEELDPDVMSRLEVNLDWLEGDYSGHTLRKLLVAIPHDRHWFPDFLLSDKPGMISPSVSENFVPWYKTAMRKTLVALTPDGKRGAIRTIDRNHRRALLARYRDLMASYRDMSEAVAEGYRARMREMTSAPFWKRYLGL